MRVVAIGCQKGGVGKSFVSANLACQAVDANASTTLIDMDPQRTTLNWGVRRHDLFNQPLVLVSDAGRLDAVLREQQDAGVVWVFIDLPGRDTALTTAGIKAADYVLIPTRPLEVDIESALATVAIAQRLKKPSSFVINAAPPQSPNRAKDASAILRRAGHSVCPAVITNRLQVSDAHAVGKGVNEFEGGGISSAQFHALFKWVDKEVMEKVA